MQKPAGFCSGQPGPPDLSRRPVMPYDRLRRIFEQIAELPVDIPPADCVRSRGRQRLGRARLRMSTIAATILLAAGFGAPQVSGSLAASPQQSGLMPEAGFSQTSSTSVRAANNSDNQIPQRLAILRTDEPSRPVPRPPSAGHVMGSGAPLLPPPGDGQLILGLDSAHRYVMTRVGAARAPVQVPGLKAVAGTPPVLATNPAGGWVVALASRQTSLRVAQARL